MAKILHIEDDIIMLRAVARILQKNNHEVISIVDGKKASEILEKDKNFDLILTDLMLPYLNGLEILSKIRTDPDLRNIPVIVISSVGGEDVVKNAFNSGADDFIKKPIMATELIFRISKLIQERKQDSKNNFLVTKRKK